MIYILVQNNQCIDLFLFRKLYISVCILLYQYQYFHIYCKFNMIVTGISIESPWLHLLWFKLDTVSWGDNIMLSQLYMQSPNQTA